MLKEQFLDEFMKIYLDEWNEDVNYLKEIKPFIKKLYFNYKLGIVTNTYHAPLIHLHLREMGIENFFTVVITSIECGYRKPNSLIFEYAAEKKLKKNQAIFYLLEIITREKIMKALKKQVWVQFLLILKIIII